MDFGSGTSPIGKVNNVIHQRTNLDSLDLELTPDEIQAINSLDKPDGTVDGQDADIYEEFE